MVKDLIESFAEKDEKLRDSLEFLELMQHITGYEPKMFGPREAAISLYFSQA